MTLKIYIAGASAEIDLLERLIHEVQCKEMPDGQGGWCKLMNLGLIVTLDWTKMVRAQGNVASPDDPAIRIQAALADLRAVDEADIVWLVAPPKTNSSTGAWVELGYALKAGKYIVVSGEGATRCIFTDKCHKFFEKHDDALEYLRSLA